MYRVTCPLPAVTSLVLVVGLLASPAAETVVPALPSAIRGSATHPLAALLGRWCAADIKQMVVVPYIGATGGQRTLAVIPNGSREGTVILEETTLDRLPRGAAARFRSAKDASARAVTVRTPAADALEICWEAGVCSSLARCHPIGSTDVAFGAVGHRAASLDQDRYENTLAAIGAAADFGSTGIEIDVTIPFESISGRNRPVPAEARVVHPPEIRAELTGWDSIPLEDARRFPTLAEALRVADGTPLYFVYLDLKLRWLRKDAEALRAVVSTLEESVRKAAIRPSLTVYVGAEVSEEGSVADVLAASSTLPWILELTSGTDPDRFLRLAGGVHGRRPDVLSLNLLRVRDTSSGFLGLFLSDVSADWERTVGALPQPRILWTAKSDSQMRGAITALARLNGGREERGAIMTPTPHRLIAVALGVR